MSFLPEFFLSEIFDQMSEFRRSVLVISEFISVSFISYGILLYAYIQNLVIFRFF